MNKLDDSLMHYVDTDFTELDVACSEIDGKTFANCTFKRSNFSEATLSSCRFEECEFVSCNLSLVKIPDCVFYETTFTDCKLLGVNWTSARWSNVKMHAPIKFTGCVVNDSSFYGLHLAEIQFQHCKIHDVDFTECVLDDASFCFSDLRHSVFRNTSLNRADFVDATNYQIDIFCNQLEQAKFSLPEASSLLNSLNIELYD
ncbi:pentapeptide repeat-containing protein [Rheinheimera metallidurans]|uniref:pentapeptide repeat-containing protein n=1 Tax=Rheinheimera metallidurans TaxID=2925781 RepID=UPI0030037FB6